MITALSLSPAVDKIYFVDDFEAGGLYRTHHIKKSAGGKGINVGRVVSMLGAPIDVLGFKAGSTGHWLESELKKLGVHTAFIEVEGESRTNINVIDRKRGQETELLEEGPFITEEAVQAFMALFQAVLDRTKVLVCSGGLPKGMEAGIYKRLIETATSKGVKVILDSSGAMLKEGIEAKPFMIKPNLRELETYRGKMLSNQTEIVHACKEIVSKGVEVVLVSLGGEGALLVTSEQVLKAHVPNVKVVNTIGSGDSTVAGCAVALSRGLPLDALLQLGMACAVANTQFEEIGVITEPLVVQYLKELVIENIE